MKEFLRPMGGGKFFKGMFGSKPDGKARGPKSAAKKERKPSTGSVHGASYRRVSVITPTERLRAHLSEQLRPLVEGEGYSYEDHPAMSVATGSQVVIMDAMPKADAILHNKYDNIVRMKKSMHKLDDRLCIIAPRTNYKKYPRGTYPKLRYFCLKEGDFDHRDEDLPADGKDTIEGPRLYNFADIGQVICSLIRELSRT